MKFKLEIQMGNEAMLTREDVARKVRQISEKIDSGYDEGRIMDDNGNKVGKWEFLEE